MVGVERDAIQHGGDALGGESLVLEEVFARALGDGDDVGGKAIRPAVEAARKGGQRGLIVAVVVVDADAHAAECSEGFRDHIGSEEVAMDDVESPRNEKPKQARKIDGQGFRG